jgi:exodeoxyribonuclease V alpha subunit
MCAPGADFGQTVGPKTNVSYRLGRACHIGGIMEQTTFTNQLSKLTNIFDFEESDQDKLPDLTEDQTLILQHFFKDTTVYKNTFKEIHYKYEDIGVLEKNPYRLIKEISGVGFKKADSVAMKYGIELDNSHRIEAGIAFFISEQCGFGNTVVKRFQIENKAGEILGVSKSVIVATLDNLIASRDAIPVKSGIELAKLYYAEKSIATTIQSLSKMSPSNNWSKIIPDDLSQDQVEAFNAVTKNRVIAIHGSAGTGKTYLQNAIVKAWEGKVVLLSPTGIAARRQRDLTGKPASTIHSFILKEEKAENTNNKPTLIVLDEMGMVTVPLFSSLLHTISERDYTLVMVGDCSQLPPIGPGAVFNDIIESDYISCKGLTVIKRHGDDSNIIKLAAKIRDRAVITGDCLTSDVTLVPVSTYEEKINAATQIGIDLGVKSTLILTVRNSWKEDICFRIKAIITKPVFLETLSVGDKVINTKNVKMPSGAIVNGDIGFIINETHLNYVIDFNAYDAPIEIEKKKHHIELGYALTAHKAQGCEEENVVVVLDNTASFFAGSSWLYTAITRAKKKLVIIGTQDELQAISNARKKERNTSLKNMLKEAEDD